MEQWLKVMEVCVVSVEVEIKMLKGQQQVVMVVCVVFVLLCLQLNDNGELKFYGDVEFNFDGVSCIGSLMLVKISVNKSWVFGDKECWDINGCILLGFDGRWNGVDG